MKDMAKKILKMAAESGCDVRLATNMGYVELREGEIAIADDGFVLVIGEKKVQVPIKN